MRTPIQYASSLVMPESREALAGRFSPLNHRLRDAAGGWMRDWAVVEDRCSQSSPQMFDNRIVS